MKFRGTIGFVALFSFSACSGGSGGGDAVESTVVVESTTTLVSTTTEESAPEIPLVVVPDVSGLNEDQAFEVLRDLGLFARFSDTESDEREGSVVLQNPAAGEEIEEGGEVTVLIAIPPTHKVTVALVVNDGLWDSLSGDECEFRENSLFVGQSVTLTGPDGESLGTALVDVAYVGDNFENPPRESCRFFFEFENVPEVRSYGLKSANSEWPQVPFASVRDFEWVIVWGSGRD